MHRSKLVLTIVATLELALAAGSSQAQTVHSLASFSFSGGGQSPESTLIQVGSTLYGTTFSGHGATGAGAVFSVPTAGGTPTMLATFGSSVGTFVTGGLTLSGSTFYGMTNEGGANNDGTIFSVPISGGTPTVLASFNGTNGASSWGDNGLTLIGTTLYGMTDGGGANGDGAIFSIPISGGTPTVLASFNGINGQQPTGSLTLIGSTLYGTTALGGANNDGTVFSIPVSGGTPTVLASFNNANGREPLGSLTPNSNGSVLYGTTSAGGTYNDGTVFSLPITGGMPTVLTSFNGANGADPYYGGLLLSNTTLYGTTAFGGNLSLNSGIGDGTVFSLPITGGTPTTLASFNGTNGADPFSGLILNGSTLYGTTSEGGTNNYGTVFALALVPEPSSLVLFGLGAIGLGVMALRRKS